MSNLQQLMANYLAQIRHKVFISFYHKQDEGYKRAFETNYSHLFISKAVQHGDIDTELSTDYIKRLIRDDYVRDCTVCVVLIGPNTYGRKHVDWEIAAALNYKTGGYSGLIGILLPEIPMYDAPQDINYLLKRISNPELPPKQTYNFDILPTRLADNVTSGYADIYTWDWLCADATRVKNAIENAFNKRNSYDHLIKNSRLQMSRNTSEYTPPSLSSLYQAFLQPNNNSQNLFGSLYNTLHP